MNYVDEKPVEKITLYLSLFETAGRSRFTVPVNDELVEVEYVAADGHHTLTIGKASVNFVLHVLGEGEVDVVYWGDEEI